MSAACADPRCEHPQGWHRKGVGSCLECGCTEFKKPSAASRAQCPRCGFSVRLRKDGTVQRHRLYQGATKWVYCDEARFLVDEDDLAVMAEDRG